MAQESSKILNISVFKFFTGTIEQFKSQYDRSTPAVREEFDNSICFIHENNDSQNGYMYAHGKYYNLGVRAKDVFNIMDASTASEVSGEIVGGDMTEMQKLRLSVGMNWVEIDNTTPPTPSTPSTPQITPDAQIETPSNPVIITGGIGQQVTLSE